MLKNILREIGYVCFTNIMMIFILEDRFLALRYKTHWSFKFILEDRF